MKKNKYLILKSVSAGFSLIEMLIVIVVFAILAYFVTQSTLQAFKGSRKAAAQSEVRDNLDFAASVVERNLRNAKLITSPKPCTGTVSSISYIDTADKVGSFSCQLGASDSYLASAAARLTNSDVFVTACSFVCTQNSTNTPPIIDLQLIGREKTNDTAEAGLIAISRRIVLRIY